jgi:phytoene synthase
MSLDACAALVARGDPERFAAVMAAPLAARKKLLPLYAFHLEVARAPWVTQEPLIAEMRLQWWRDVVAEPAPRAHEVAAPLHALIVEAQLPIGVFDRLIAARSWDVHAEPHASDVALADYLEATGAGLMWLAALALGGQAEPQVRAYGWAAALANYLRAVPELMSRGKRPLPDASDAGLRALAEEGLRRLAFSRTARIGAGRPALLAGWQAGALLRQVRAEPGRVLDGSLGLSEFSKRGRLAWQAFSGRY